MRIFMCSIFSHFSISSPLNAQLTKTSSVDVIIVSHVSNRLPWEDGPGHDLRTEESLFVYSLK